MDVAARLTDGTDGSQESQGALGSGQDSARPSQLPGLPAGCPGGGAPLSLSSWWFLKGV